MNIGDSLKNFEDTILLESTHPISQGLTSDNIAGGTLFYECLDLFGADEDLIETDSPPIPRIETKITAD